MRPLFTKRIYYQQCINHVKLPIFILFWVYKKKDNFLRFKDKRHRLSFHISLQFLLSKELANPCQSALREQRPNTRSPHLCPSFFLTSACLLLGLFSLVCITMSAFFRNFVAGVSLNIEVSSKKILFRKSREIAIRDMRTMCGKLQVSLLRIWSRPYPCAGNVKGGEFNENLLK